MRPGQLDNRGQLIATQATSLIPSNNEFVSPPFPNVP